MAVGRTAVLGTLGASLTAATLLLVPTAPPLPLLADAAAAPPAASSVQPALAPFTPAEAMPDAPVREPVADQPPPADDPPVPPADLARWIEDLRDDHIKGNATRALRRLIGSGRAAHTALLAALPSFDRQQRQLAALVLRITFDGPPPPRLLEVSVEALRRDVSRELWSTIIHPAASSSTCWLARHADGARPALRTGLLNGDDQQRFLCAFLLAASGHADDRAIVGRELVTHLGDNSIDGDALMATHALYRLGDGAREIVAAWRPYVDAQARSLLDLVLVDLDAPPKSLADLRRRGTMHQATSLYHDPAIEYQLGRSRVATW